MKVIIQRVSRASVTVDNIVRGEIGTGFLVLLGIRKGDSPDNAIFLASKTARLRVFEDDAGKMNLALKDINGAALVVSQFTLYADTKKGNRPGFENAEKPDVAEKLYNVFVEAMRNELGSNKVATGVFGTSMQVELINNGPVTIELSTD